VPPSKGRNWSRFHLIRHVSLPHRIATVALALASALLTLATSAPFDCRPIRTPQLCMRTHTCMWWDICFKNAEDYYHAYYNGRVVHCRSIKDDMRGVRVIVVTPKSGS